MTRKTALHVTVFLCLASLLTWAREDRLVNTGFAPAAMGTIETSHDRNGNTRIDIKVKHMAAPESLTPARNAYVVWLVPRGQAAQTLGQLRINGGTLEGSLAATTPEKIFDIVITAEDNPNPSSPSGPEILKGTVERK